MLFVVGGVEEVLDFELGWGEYELIVVVEVILEGLWVYLVDVVMSGVV